MAKRKKQTSSDFFLGSRNLNFVLVGSLLFLSNINGTQLVGENESVYTNNMTVMAWGMTSVLAMIIVSEFFMPIYLKSGVITTPEYLEQRFDKVTQQIVSLIFLVSYLVNMLPSVLYSGAVVFKGLFDWSGYLGINDWYVLVGIVWFLGVSATIYALIGGVRILALSDTLLGLSLLIGGISLPYFGIKALGNGNVEQGFTVLLSSHRTHFNAIGSSEDAIPFSTIFTGMLLINLNYWGIEQYIVQRALSAKNLAESQKGLALAAVGKLLSPLMLNLPGIIAVHLYPNIANSAEVFPKLAGDVLPNSCIFFIAFAILGAAITGFNAGLTSSSTLFVINIYKPYFSKKYKTELTDKQQIKVAKYFQVMVAILAMCIAPFIYYVKGGFYNYLQMVGSIFSVPIFTIIFVGFVTKSTPAFAAKVGLLFFVSSYVILQFFCNTGIHYLHLLGILFVITTVIMLLIGKIYPRETPFSLIDKHQIDIHPWKNRYAYYAVLLLLMVFIYILFSPLGLAK